MKTPKGMKIHYIFVRPHKSLQNRTPAQKLGVIDKKTKWMDLLEFVLKKQ